MPDLNEARTRKQLIDPQLERAGWDLHDPDQVRFEIPVDGFDPAAWQTLHEELSRIGDERVAYETDLPSGICDYALYRQDGDILAIVEAKRESADPRIAELQAEFYVTAIAKHQDTRPFAFLSNGHDTYFCDVGRAPPRRVYGFFSCADLENLLYLRQNARPFAETPPKLEIADRIYQQEAIRRTCQAFEGGRRKTLLVMATGTGKTRTAMSLIDVFLRANQARKILFVADRDALVQQALDDGFKAFFQEGSTRIYSDDIDTTKRLFVVTLQTLNNVYRRFTPGFFDLIVFDEVHRSIFSKWKEPLYYFDARMIGLTATPAEFVDRNTFLAFECHDGVPTFNYTYRQAVEEGYLVDYTLYAAQTGFQRHGIHGAELSEEEINTLIEMGIDPDDLDYSGTDLEVKVSNRGTLRAQWQEVMAKCYHDPSGLPGKTIVFALTQGHAERLREVFDELYPAYHDLRRVITYQTKYVKRAIRDFKRETKPRIAISVDMLETGIDVPECVNLVFMRPVQSRIKLEQMIGRGTRCRAACDHPEWLPNEHKTDFLIVDFWQNEFNKPADEVRTQSLSVLVTLFNTRLKLLERYLDDQLSDEARQVVADLRAQIARIPTAAYAVKTAWSTVRAAWDDDFWDYLTRDNVALLRDHVAPLLRYVPDVDVGAETFAHKVERFKLRAATGADTRASLREIAEDAGRIPPSLIDHDDRAQAARRLCLSPQRLRQASVDELNQAIAALAGWMKKRARRTIEPLLIDLDDEIAFGSYVLLEGMPEPVYAQEYRRRVEDAVLDLVAGHPTVEAIARGESVSDAQILELERALRHELGQGDLHLTEHNIHVAYRDQDIQVGSLIEFLRYILGLDGIPDYAEVVARCFAEYVAGQPFNADQTRFLRAVQSVFLQRRRLQRVDLYEPPLSTFGQKAVERWFSAQQVDDLLAFAQTLTVTGD